MKNKIDRMITADLDTINSDLKQVQSNGRQSSSTTYYQYRVDPVLEKVYAKLESIKNMIELRGDA